MLQPQCAAYLVVDYWSPLICGPQVCIRRLSQWAMTAMDFDRQRKHVRSRPPDVESLLAYDDLFIAINCVSEALPEFVDDDVALDAREPGAPVHSEAAVPASIDAYIPRTIHIDYIRHLCIYVYIYIYIYVYMEGSISPSLYPRAAWFMYARVSVTTQIVYGSTHQSHLIM